MESSGSDGGIPVNKCLLNPCYTPNSPEFSIRSLVNIPVLKKTMLLVLLEGRAYVVRLHSICYSDMYITDNKYLLKEQINELG